MSTEVGRASLGLYLDSKPVEHQMSAMTGKLQSIASGIGAKLGAALSIAAVTKFAKSCLDLGSDLSEVQNVVDVTFGSMRKSVNAWAADAWAAYGLSETMAKQYIGTYGAMSKAFGFTEAAAYDMSTALTGLAGDVASFYNMTQEEAYTKLKSVFTGETESLKSLGVVMTQAALDQFALANGFGKTTSAMTEQEKVALRYQFVMDKLSLASGDFARTSDGWANQTRLLRLQFESFEAAIGQGLIAALTPAIKALNSFMGVLVKAANTFKAFVYSLFGKTSQDMGAGSGAGLTDVLGGIADSGTSAADAIGGVGDSAAGAASQIRRSLFGFDQINKLMDQTSGSGGGGSGGGGGGLGDTASALLSEAWDVAGEDGPLDRLVERFSELKDIFTGGFWDGFGDTSVFESIQGNLSNIKASLTSIFSSEGVAAAARDYEDSLARAFGTVTGSAASIGASITDNLTGGLSLYLEQHGDELSAWSEKVLGNFTRLNNSAGSISKAIANIFSVLRTPEAKQFTADVRDMISQPFLVFSEEFSGVTADIADLIAAIMGDGSAAKSTLQEIFGIVDDAMPSLREINKFAWTARIRNLLAPLYALKTVLEGLLALLKPEGTTVNENGHSHSSGKIEVTAAVTSVTDKLKQNKKVLDKFTVKTTAVTDKIASTKKTLSDFTAELKEKKDSLRDKTVTGMTAKFTGVSDLLSSGQKTFGVTARFTDSTDSLTEEKKTLLSKAKFVDTIKNGLTDEQTKVNARAALWAQKYSDGSLAGLGDMYANTQAKMHVTKYSDGSVSGLGDLWAGIKGKITEAYSALSYYPESEVKGKIVRAYDGLTYYPEIDVVAKIVSTGKTIGKALGGVYSGGSWKPITAYAGGGSPAGGQLFLAREAGPELVGTLGGHTAVMNNDQIVASVASGVAKAISEIKFIAKNNGTPQITALGASVSRSEQYLSIVAKQTEAATKIDNLERLLRQILEALTTMDFDVKLDGASVKDRIVQMVNAHTRATGVCEITI